MRIPQITHIFLQKRLRPIKKSASWE